MNPTEIHTHKYFPLKKCFLEIWKGFFFFKSHFEKEYGDEWRREEEKENLNSLNIS